MGLAASQCRLLLLTARLSDTEYRAQVISQRRMALAMQSEQIAMEYTRKLNNRTLRHIYALDANQNNTTIKEPLTYYTLTGTNSALGGGQFRVVTVDGKIAVPSIEDIPRIVVSKGENGNAKYNVITNDLLLQFLNNYEGEDAESVKKLIKDNMTDSDYAEVYSIIKSDNAAYSAFNEFVANNETAIPLEATSGTIAVNGTEYMVLPALAKTEYFQNALRTGGVYVEQYQKYYGEKEGWASFDIIDSQYISDELDTTDDAAAQAEYESKTAMIQSQDKLLELELKQVETQHKAAETEYESVKKVMDKNIERSFKTFG